MRSENQNYLFESEISKFDLNALRKVLSLFNSKKLKILEIGSWSGLGSTKVFAEYSRELVCVDTWEGNKGVAHNNVLKNIVPYQEFLKNISEFKEKVKIIKKSSDQALDKLCNEKFDVIFIDGDHRYNYIRSDIDKAFNILDKNGIIIGHDCELNFDSCNKEKKKIILENKNKDTIISITKKFKHNHCGVILAVSETKCPKFFFCDVPLEFNNMNGQSSIFVLQKNTNKFSFFFKKINRLNILFSPTIRFISKIKKKLTKIRN